MPKISNLSVIIAYDIADDDRRSELEDYLTDRLGATQRTRSVYEYKYAPPPSYKKVLVDIRAIIEPDDGDEVFAWDLEDGQLRRIAVHQL